MSPGAGEPLRTGGFHVSNRRSVLTTTSPVAIGLSLLPAAAGGNTSGSRQISETRKVIVIGTQGKPGTAGFRLIAVGTLAGRIGASLRVMRSIAAPTQTGVSHRHRAARRVAGSHVRLGRR